MKAANGIFAILAIAVVLLITPNCARQPKASPPPEIVQYYDASYRGDPERLAAIVQQFLPIRATFDTQTNLVILYGSPKTVEEALGMGPE